MTAQGFPGSAGAFAPYLLSPGGPYTRLWPAFAAARVRCGPRSLRPGPPAQPQPFAHGRPALAK
jgi:hypothetical protein